MDQQKNMTHDRVQEPEKRKTYRCGDLVFKVGSYYAATGKDTLKDILERSIRREAAAQIKR